jgi:hypothetical protein
VGSRRRRALGAAAWVAAGVACLALAWVVVRSASASPDGWLGEGSGPGVEAVAPHDALWVRLLRGGLGRLVVPALLVGAGVCLVVLLRRGRWRRALVGGAAVLGAIGLVQAVKRGMLPFGADTAPVLSGHMPVVVGAAVVLVLTVPDHRRVTGVVVGAAAVVLTGVGVVLAAWHTPGQVLAATALAVGWCLLLAPAAAAAVRAEPVGPRT